MSIKNRGFASFTKEKRLAAASKGGKNAQLSGKAHLWTVEEARIAGRLGGKAGKHVK